jgi:PAS domain S-box-containing protein
MTYNDIRLLAVERFKNLDLETDIEFREFVEMASLICSTPISLLTVMDEDTQWLKVRKGTDAGQMPVKTSFCKHTLLQDEVMIVRDTLKDERFVNSPIVAGEPNIRFYAGTPLITRDGHRVGTLCVIDLEPHELNSNQQLMLKMLGKQAIDLMDFRISLELLRENEIEVVQQRETIEKAAIKQRSFFESSANFHILLGKNGEVIDFNKVAYTFIKRMHGVKLTRGSMFVNFLAPDFINKFTEYFNLALTGKNAFAEGSTDYGTNGIIYWEASFETARDTNNEIIGISYIIRDVSDRKIKEHKIIEQNQSLIKIAHLQAHEFRAPLTTIKGMMNLIKSEDYNAPREYFELLENAVNNLDEKIHEIVNDVDNIVMFNSTEVYAV